MLSSRVDQLFIRVKRIGLNRRPEIERRLKGPLKEEFARSKALSLIMMIFSCNLNCFIDLFMPVS